MEARSTIRKLHFTLTFCWHRRRTPTVVRDLESWCQAAQASRSLCLRTGYTPVLRSRYLQNGYYSDCHQLIGISSGFNEQIQGKVRSTSKHNYYFSPVWRGGVGCGRPSVEFQVWHPYRAGVFVNPHHEFTYVVPYLPGYRFLFLDATYNTPHLWSFQM